MAQIKVSGSWKIPNQIQARVSGTWRRMHMCYVNVLGVWKLSWQEEVVAYATSGANQVIVDYFAAADWNNPLVRKRFVIPTGVEIGATNATYALTTSYYAGGAAGSFAGDLIVDNYGTISGMGGAANSGVGGNAVQAQHGGQDGRKYTFNNYGTIRAGGGGGGKGGNGGSGSYVSVRQPASGWSHVNNAPPYTTWATHLGIYWNSSSPIIAAPGTSATTVTSGGWTYLRGVQQADPRIYSIARQQTASSTGGTGGNGARGQGFDGAAGTGANGAAGGTNAGAGGKGGDGGGWGASGATGATGASGNVSGGTAGAAGGLAGFYLAGSAYITLNNYGTVQGRYA